MGRLDNRVAFITGVASGIGRAAAELFTEHGAVVFGVDYNEPAGQALAAALQAKGRSFQFFVADLSTEAACVQAVNQCYQTYGRIDILYNNAGISILEPFATTNAETLERILAVNFKSVFYLCQQVLPIMQRQGDGVVINTASELAIVAEPLYAAYSASKGAVLSLTRALALEYAGANIRINTICPGPVETPLLQMEFEQATDPAKAKADGVARMPIGRLGKPEEIAQFALFLASDAPSLLHGASLIVDGGKTIV